MQQTTQTDGNVTLNINKPYATYDTQSKVVPTADLVHLLLSIHVAGKVICNQEPVVALGHVVHIIHQVLEIHSIAKSAVSDPASEQQLLQTSTSNHDQRLVR